MNLIENFKKNKIFWGLMIFIFILHLLTYPSVHYISDDKIYLDIAARICKLNFSDYTGRVGDRMHPPLYPTIVCLTSFFHHFDLAKAQLINFVYFIFGLIGWYFSTSFLSEDTRKRFILLLFANNLIWIYSFRVLLDISAFIFLSLGLMNAYLFLEYRKKKNYYLTIIFISIGSFTSELTAIFLPIMLVYLLLKKNRNVRDWSFLVLSYIPYLIYQLIVGFKDIWLFGRVIKATGMLNVAYIPYAHFPTILYMAGVLGPGIISCFLVWKNISKFKTKNYITFFLVIYLIWETIFDFLASANLPRYNITLIPFLSLMISDSYDKDKKYRYLYYLALIYCIITGFLAAYYFHLSELPIWKNKIIDITKIKI